MKDVFDKYLTMKMTIKVLSVCIIDLFWKNLMLIKGFSMIKKILKLKLSPTKILMSLICPRITKEIKKIRI